MLGDGVMEMVGVVIAWGWCHGNGGYSDCLACLHVDDGLWLGEI